MINDNYFLIKCLRTSDYLKDSFGEKFMNGVFVSESFLCSKLSMKKSSTMENLLTCFQREKERNSTMPCMSWKSSLKLTLPHTTHEVLIFGNSLKNNKLY